jgi:hypothetical protein
MRNLFLFATLLIASVAQATVIWRGDFSTGDRTQWQRFHAAEAQPPRITVLPHTVVPDGANSEYVAKYWLPVGDEADKLDVTTGDKIADKDYKHRAELVHDKPLLNEGDERWYGWRVWIPPEWSVTDGKNGGAVIAQWHHGNMAKEDYSGSPPLLFVAKTSTLEVQHCPQYLCPSTEYLYRGPLPKGQWIDFQMHAVFSSAKNLGTLEVWMNGEKIVDRIHNIALMFPSQDGGKTFYQNYMLAGLYPRPTVQENLLIYQDGWIEATSREDLVQRDALVQEPEPEPQPDGGDPAPDVDNDPSTDAGPSDDGDASDAGDDGDASQHDGPEPSTPDEPSQGGCATSGGAGLALLAVMLRRRLKS